jgi:hypothetical protein
VQLLLLEYVEIDQDEDENDAFRNVEVPVADVRIRVVSFRGGPTGGILILVPSAIPPLGAVG